MDALSHLEIHSQDSRFTKRQPYATRWIERNSNYLTIAIRLLRLQCTDHTCNYVAPTPTKNQFYFVYNTIKSVTDISQNEFVGEIIKKRKF